MSSNTAEAPEVNKRAPELAAQFYTDPFGKEPIRAELYGLEHLQTQARKLAEASIVLPGMRMGRSLIRRFNENGLKLLDAYKWITEATRRKETITSDAEWLLDNFHIIEDTLREIHVDLPRGYYRKLPKLAAGPFAGFPRVYTLALELIAHTDSSLDETNITRFVQAYQTLSPLAIGELWAVPIMLRLSLIENLRRLADQMIEAWSHRREAESCCKRLVAEKDRYEKTIPLPPLASVLRPEANWSDAFTIWLHQTLRDHGPDVSWIIDWLESHLLDRGCPPAEVLRREQQRQAANQVSIGNSVTSLRLLSALDWHVLFERMSLVEEVLKDDPAGVYAAQDFATKDRYRRTVEVLARGANCDELSVARSAVGLARRNSGAFPDQRRLHIGYYLVDKGRSALAAQLRYRPRLRDWLIEKILAYPAAIYFSATAVAFSLILGPLIALTSPSRAAALGVLVAALVLPVGELAIGLVHYLVTLVIPPRVLPKLELKEGVPTECATFVVMPTMLIRPESAQVLAERLEVHYLSNPDAHVYFGLLTDFADAPTESMPEDGDYLRAAQEQIKRLNERHAAGGPERFFLFHRRRVWNPVQGCWMGWERKRGKLEEFNRWLRGASDTTFMAATAKVGEIPKIRYVITLDADTYLPRETARRLIGTLAHPLNRAIPDRKERRIVEGYGVLQPRVGLNLVAATRSRFSRILTSSAGIDPYTTAVSDVYQDLFGIGSFTGKGIYDVDNFSRTAGRAFPENSILSHDLIEGNYARCGLVSDIELLDDFPARYHAYGRRQHRWIRGDWQLLPWLGRKVPAPRASDQTGQSAEESNPLPLVERWKIFDNLRRSLVPPALVILLIAAWLLPGLDPWLWTGVALAVPALPLLFVGINALSGLMRPGSWKLKLRGLADTAKCTGGQVVLAIIFLADQGRLTVDAVVRTLCRLVTRRHLLDWETAAAAERRLGDDFASFCLTMWLPAVLAASVALLIAFLRPESLVPAGPILLAWLVSPAVAFWVSQPLKSHEKPLSAQERRELRRLARRTWDFFEQFAGAGEQWLPPDNYQEDPKGSIAHRTSPTNIGLYLLSTLAAHDLGYISLPVLLDRLENTFDTLDRLERIHGHLFNWYETTSLKPLQPGYISTVDSGNLLACLIALKQGLREKIEAPIPAPAWRSGLADTLSWIGEELKAIDPLAVPEHLQIFRALELDLEGLTAQLETPFTEMLESYERLAKLNGEANDFLNRLTALSKVLNESPEELEHWTRRFTVQVKSFHDELLAVAPWLDSIDNKTQEQHQLPANQPMKGFADRWPDLMARLLKPASAADLRMEIDTILLQLSDSEEATNSDKKSEMGSRPPVQSVDGLVALLQSSIAPELVARCQRVADRAGALGSEMDFQLLYNEQRHLFAIGYNVDHNRLDNAHYDLLASEACLTSFLAICRGDVPKRHWFHLGRPLTRAGGSVVLLSWGGTMFEYLMPRLLLRSYSGTLLDESCRAAVDRQIEYGWQHEIPWGISESAFSALDASLDYQYQAFGVPGLGLKRGLADNLVVAPYATALAMAVRPRVALENFRTLRLEQAMGPYGFYEALDYTRDRMEEKRQVSVVRSYMAHHQGMTLVALVNCLCGNTMVRRFHSEPMVRSTELLLQERVPKSAPLVNPHSDEAEPAPLVRDRPYLLSRALSTPHTPHPRTHLLSNGRYNVMVTNSGGGYSTCGELDVTRWREDGTLDSWGQFIYVRDLRRGLTWSAAYQPSRRQADSYEVVFSSDKAEFSRIDGDVKTDLEVTVSPENAAEVRRLTLSNRSARTRELEVTSYLEIVLGSHGSDLAHPAFGKLFLETEFVQANSAILCRRRPRAEEQKPIWAVHVLAVEGPMNGEVQFETDRLRFLGRGRTPQNAVSMEPGAVLSRTAGPVLDPILSLRHRVRVHPGASVSVAFATAVAESREEALALADQYHEFHGVNRAFELAWAHSQVQLQHLRLSPEESHLFQRLAAPVIYTGSTLRSAKALAANRQGQTALWRHGISGDKPIVLVRVAENEELGLVRQLLSAHAYWRLKGLVVDLVILNDHPASYLENLHEQIQNLVRVSESHPLVDKPGGVFVRRATQLSEDDKILLQAAARVVLIGSRGSLEAQINRADRVPPLPARLAASQKRREASESVQASDARNTPENLLFWNGLGGFNSDGREYCVLPYGLGDVSLSRKAERSGGRAAGLPPAPWINVVANPFIGFLVSESGAGYTWAGNSQSNRLTPWNNDPVSDPTGEVIFVRDEATGEYWTPTPLPLGGQQFQEKVDRAGSPASTGTTTGSVCHGHGYTVFRQASHGLEQELLLFVPLHDPVKIVRLRIKNLENRTRQLSATFFCEWVLGTVRDQTAPYVVPSFDSDSGALLVQNPFNADFSGRMAFAAVNRRPRTFTADRAEFLGRNGSIAAPAALSRVTLSGRADPGIDPCAALMAPFDLRPGEEKEVLFFLGQASGLDEVQRLLSRYRDPAAVQAAFEEIRKYWERVLSAVEVRTPDPAMDLMLNHWLLYQVLSCRVWARSAFYQSGGAYGFRDQLQDVMALVYGAPEEERTHLLRAARRQFREGDVQHWWHPPSGRGVRTRFSDDFLWLPFVACHYVEKTGDLAILDERVPFLQAPLLRPDQEEDYGLPEVTQETATLYEHCIRAVENGLRFGSHGLPLMGSGDWNDGMNRVGVGGKGESVWDAWFLITILNRFAGLADTRNDGERAARYREQAQRLSAAIEEHAWDGRWYRRAYFDDGTPLGSAQNDECRIDSIVQSWAVISDAANPDRARQAIGAVEELLVRPEDKLILLFAPPFDKGKLHPGYIKGYLPGIRENGGQYTHAAVWVVQAAALLGQGSLASRLFNLLNPIHHASAAGDVSHYRVEPYIIAADIYSQPPHTGRGGWTWYTGSAGWLYRIGLENILGLRVEGNKLRMEPCIPREWKQYELTYRYRSTVYHVTVHNPDGVERGVRSVRLDGEAIQNGAIELKDDHRNHDVQVTMGK